MGLLLRLARRLLALRSLAPITALHRPTRCAFFQSFASFTTAPTRDDETQEKRVLTRDQRLELLPQTLQVFHARHGHFVMHFGYTVPKQDESDAHPDHPDLPPYPDAARGLALGTRSIGYSYVLEAIGFPVDVDWEQYVWEHQRLPALRAYQNLYDDLRVPPSFVVPTGDKRWPIETWGFKLGRFTENIKSRDHRDLRQKHLEDLDQLNASWWLKELTPVQRLALLVPTLKVFYAKYGHFVMSYGFVVPRDQDSDVKQIGRGVHSSDEAWPLEASGEKLGHTLRAFLLSESQRDEHQDLVQALSNIGFPVNVDWKDYVFERQPLAALRAYQELHGDCRVSPTFVVRTGDTKWPIETWGFKLELFVNHFQASGHRSTTQEQLDALAAVGLPLNLNELTFTERLPLLAPTLRAFHARYGHFIMHGRFTVPKEDDSDANPHLPRYPPETCSVNLGNTPHRLLISEQRRQKHSHVLQELERSVSP